MFLKNQPRFYMVARLYGNEGENKVFPGGSDSKESACNAEDLGSIHVLGIDWATNTFPSVKWSRCEFICPDI